MKKDKVVAALLCLILGSAGIHFIYLGLYRKAWIRFLWLMFCNPVAFIKSWIEAYQISTMTEYQFQVKYCKGHYGFVDRDGEIIDIDHEDIYPNQSGSSLPVKKS